MVSNRLKDFIFKKLYGELSHVEIIHYKTFVWFIDRENKCWYFRYDKSNGLLLWKYGFFSNFFTIFTMDSNEFTPIISSWVEEVLNCRITTTDIGTYSNSYMVEEVLNCKVTTTSVVLFQAALLVEEVLNCKVTTTRIWDNQWLTKVEEVLNCKVTTTSLGDGVPLIWVEEVLNHNVAI